MYKNIELLQKRITKEREKRDVLLANFSVVYVVFLVDGRCDGWGDESPVYPENIWIFAKQEDAHEFCANYIDKNIICKVIKKEKIMVESTENLKTLQEIKVIEDKILNFEEALRKIKTKNEEEENHRLQQEYLTELQKLKKKYQIE